MHESLFLGPHGENAEFFRQIWESYCTGPAAQEETFPGDSESGITADSERIRLVEREIANFSRSCSRSATFSNRYLGHMISDVSIPALIGNAAVLFCNPNLASKEVASAGLKLEMQAINRSWPG